MPAFKRVRIPGNLFYEEIVLPSFGDFITDQDYRNGFFGEFRVLDNVSSDRKIVDISPVKNILKRRDASCKIEFSPVGKADARRLSVTELYGATMHCAQEFYQGCLKDYREGNSAFVENILPFFRKAIREDMLSLVYFGDTSRVDAAGAVYNTDKFDGIFTQYKKHIADGRIDGDQVLEIPNAVVSPANAKAYFEDMLAAQDEYMEMLDDTEKAFYVDRQWANAYEDYLIAAGATNGEAVNYVQDGIRVRAYKGIPIFVNKVFKPILKQITGDENPHLGILTLRGNFLFGTDSSYGEGPNLDIALNVWYDWDELSWKYLQVMKAGTAIALPEHSVLAMPE